MTYYNEHDSKAAAWLRELIKAGLIPAGDVDERDIQTISPHDLTGYTQQHFFAGIGGWAYALRLARWPDSRPVRTGSCPCQPFSSGGLQLGEKDPRHLWPWFRDLITFGEPTITFGEQVASPLGREWLSGIRADLEGMGYEVGAADLCAAGIAAPQLRQRLYWMAYSHRERLAQRSKRHGRTIQSGQQTPLGDDALRCSDFARLAGSAGEGREGCIPESHEWREGLEQRGEASRLGDTDDAGSQGRRVDRNGASEWTPWAASVGICGNDGTWRRVEPGIPPLVTRLPGRVALIRGSGNAIVPQLAAEFILACEEAIR